MVLEEAMTTQSSPQEIMPGLAFCLHPDGYIHEYIVSLMSPAVVEVWAAKVQADTEAMPRDATLFNIFDLAQINKVTLPSYLRETMQKMAKELSDKGISHASYQAIILPRNFMTHFVRIFLNSMPNMNQANMHVFFSREAGYQWLQGKLEQYLNTHQAK